MMAFSKLQPHYNLKVFILYGYGGTRLPSWAPTDDLASVLPNLEHITIGRSQTYHHLPLLSRLPHLRHLEICWLPSLEYIEEKENVSNGLFFPSLQCLRLTHLPKLKGWCRGLDTAAIHHSEQERPLSSQSVSCRLELHIFGCPLLRLTSMPISSVQRFHLPTFTILVNEYWWLSEASRGSWAGISIDSDHFLISTPWEHYLKGDSGSLCIENFNELNIPPPNMSDALREMSSCLTSLTIQNSPGLKTIPKELEHLTGLRELHIESCHDFTFDDEKENKRSRFTQLESLEIGELSSLEITCQEGEMSWKGFNRLESLSLKDLPKMVRLPEWIQFVSSFQKLKICDCNNLLLPEWVRRTFYRYKLNLLGEETDLFNKSIGEGSRSATWLDN